MSELPLLINFWLQTSMNALLPTIIVMVMRRAMTLLAASTVHAMKDLQEMALSAVVSNNLFYHCIGFQMYVHR